MTINIDQTLRNARAEIKAGRPGLARAAMLEALDRYPTNTRLMTLLIEAQEAATGLPARPFTQAHVRRYLQIKANLGILNALEEAVAWVRINPRNASAHNLFGQGLFEADHKLAGLKHLKLAVTLDPAYWGASLNFSNGLKAIGKTTEAGNVLVRALKHNPDEVPLLQALTQIRAIQKRDAEAVEIFERLEKNDPDNADLKTQLLAAMVAAGQLDKARTGFQQARLKWPNDFRFMVNHGNFLFSEGDLAGAEAEFRRAIDAHPNAGSLYFSLCRVLDLPADDPKIKTMLDLLEAPSSTEGDKTALHFALSKTFEALGEVDAAFKHLQLGNDLRSKAANYSFDVTKSFYKDLMRRFARDALPPLTPTAPIKRRPVFILGMMRSGTTLTEQILSSHPLVYGAGELENLSAVLARELEPPAKEFTTETLQRIRDGYLEMLDALPGSEPVVVDKLPANYRLIGLIRKALPEARILHMQRDPVAVCWSIYKTFFTNIELGYTNSLQDVMAYHDLYTDVMDFWRSEYPGEFMEVDYEKLTRDPETSIRAILDYCGLEFDPACLAPENNKKSVRTASIKQVRSGIYTGSSSKWRGFEPYLAPLVEHFAARS